MSMVKRGFALFLAAVMLMSALPMTAFAEEVDSEPEVITSETEPEATTAPPTEPTTAPPSEPTTEPTAAPATEPSGVATEPEDETADPTEESGAAEETADPTGEANGMLPPVNSILLLNEEPSEDEASSLTGNQDFSFSMLWLDSGDMYDTRPTLDKDSFLSKFGITFLSGDGDSFSEDDEAVIRAALAAAIENAAYTPATKTGATSAVTLNLPTKFTDAEGREHEIKYFVQQTVSDLGCGGDHQGRYHPAEWDGKSDLPKPQYPLAGNPVFKETYYRSFQADINWQDDTDVDKKRPNPTMTLRRYIYGESGIPDESYEVEVPLKDGQPDWPNVPRFDEAGHPYIYYADFKGIQEQDDKKNLAAAEGRTGHYEVTYENKGAYADQKDSLFEGGRSNNLLVDKNRFDVTKIWKDELEGTERGKRPNAYLYLSRVVVTEENKDNPFTNSKPVQGYDGADVPKFDTDETPDIIQIPIGVKDGLPDLPMYDAEGRRYIYYAWEVGLTGDYMGDIQNLPENLPGKYQYLAEIAHDHGYILNEGNLTNILVHEFIAAPTKIFQADALQTMNPQTRVTMKLQTKPKNGGSWAYYTDENGETVTSVINGFRPEEQSQIGGGIMVDRYDDQGREMIFRWVETEILVNGKSSQVPEDAQFVWMDKLGEGETDVGFEITYHPDGTTITNSLQGVYQLEAEKSWSIWGLAYDPSDFTLNGKPLKAEDEEGTVTYPNQDWAIAELAKALLKGIEEPSEEERQAAEDRAQALYDELIAEEAIEQVQFRVLRDGVALYKCTVDGQTVFGTADELGGDAEPVFMNVRGDKDWVELQNFPRYDSLGCPYRYDMEEALPENSKWGNNGIVDYTVGTGTYEGKTVPKLNGSIDNYRGIGEGEDTFTFLAEKFWLDAGDAIPRQPVTVGVYEVDGSGSALATAVLNYENNWRGYLSIPQEAGKTIGDYIVKEVSVGGVTVDYGSVTNTQIKNNLEKVTHQLFAENPMDFTVQQYRSGTAAYSEDGRTEDGLLQMYNVYIGGGDATETSASYTIYNQRTAKVLLELKKEWRIGDDDPKDCTFQVQVTGDSIDGSLWLSGDSEASIGGAAREFTLTEENCTNHETWEEDKCHIVEYVEGDAEYSFLRNLPKYDMLGRTLHYSFQETKIGGESLDGKTAPYKIGDDYLTTEMSRDVTYADELPDGKDNTHRTNDLYQFTAKNTRQDTVRLIIRKVWQDDGTGAVTDATLNEYTRPDIYFNVYRTTAPQSAVLAGSDDLDEEEFLGKFQWSTLRDEERGYELNDWYWECDLGEADRYDGLGRPYVYFATEGYDGNETADYQHVYYNGHDFPKVQSGCDSTEDVFPYGHSTLGNDRVIIVMDGKDGVSREPFDVAPPENLPGGQRYYSATVVNYREGSKTLNGMKLWNLPKGQENVKPPFEVALFVLERELTPEELDAARVTKADGKFQLTLRERSICYAIDDTSIAENTANPSWKFPTDHIVEDGGYFDAEKNQLTMYDDFGRRYYYYMGEVMDPKYQGNYPSGDGRLVSKEMEYKLINTFVPQEPPVNICVNKHLISEVEGVAPIDLNADTTFKLYVQASDEHGNAIGTASELAGVTVTRKIENGQVVYGLEGADAAVGTESVKIAQITNGTADGYTLTFQYGTFTIGGQAITYRLPCYGPNHQPYIYFIKEAVPSGYEAKEETPAAGNTSASFLSRAFGWLRAVFTAAPDRTPGGQELETDPIKPDGVSGAGSTDITNYYVADVKTDLTVSKRWIGDWENNSKHPDYRPDKIVLQLWRKAGGEEAEKVTTNYKGAAIDPNGTGADNVNVTVVTQNAGLTGSIDAEGKVTVTGSSAGAKDIGAWTVSVSNLAKYAPDGTAYTYFVKEADLDQSTDPNDKYYNYKPGGTEADDGIHVFPATEADNSLDRVQIYARKIWKQHVSGETNSRKLSAADFYRLYQLGALPQSISFQLQSRTDTGSWTAVPNRTATFLFPMDTIRPFEDVKEGDKVTVVGVKSDFDKMESGIYFSFMPKFVMDSGKTQELQYRFVETMDWGGGRTTVAALDANPTDAADPSHTSNGSGSIDAELDVVGTTANGRYQFEFHFTNTIWTRPLEVHKYWADGNDQDGLRPDLGITVSRDAGAGTYGFKLTSANQRADAVDSTGFNHYFSGTVYVPLYKNEHNPNAGHVCDNSCYSTYAAAESIPDSAKAYYGPLTHDSRQGKDLYAALKQAYTGLPETGAFLNGTAPRAFGTKTAAGDASGADTVADADNYNKFVFANEQTKRKTLSLKAAKVWDDPADPLEISRPDSIFFQLQYKNADGDWVRADQNCNWLANVTATLIAGRDNNWTVEWKGVYENAPGAHPIEYRVVEVMSDKQTGITDNSVYPYTWKQGCEDDGDVWHETGWKVDKENQTDLITDKSTTVVNTLKTDSLKLIKTFTGAYENLMLPKSVTFKLWYKAADANGTYPAAWTPCPVGKGENGYEVKSTAASSHLRIFTAEENIGSFTVELNGNSTISTTVSGLPRYDRYNRPIKYAVSEESVTYDKTDIPAHGALDSNGTWTGTVGPFSGTVTTGRANALTTTWTTLAGNGVESAETSLTVTKIWNDEHDRDDLRKNGITLDLYRDDVKFISVNYVPATKTAPAVQKVTGWKNGVEVSLDGKNVSVAESGDVWTFTFTNLPLYRNTAAGNPREPSVYKVAEQAVTGYTTTSTGNENLTLDENGTAAITNTHNVESFDLTAAKQWSDFQNKYGQRPDSVTFRLEYRLEGEGDGDWKPVVHYDAPTARYAYPTADKAYTISSVEQTIRADEKTDQNADGTWRDVWAQKAVWRGLRKNVLVDGVRKSVEYQIVEEGLDTPYTSDAANGIVIKTPTEGTSAITVTNALDGVKTITVNKTWDDQNNAYGTRPDSIQVKLQYLTRVIENGIQKDVWADVAEDGAVDLTEEQNWQHTFINLRDDLTYRVIEVSMTYLAEEEEVVVDLTDEREDIYAPYQVNPLETDPTPSDVITVNLRNALSVTSLTAEKKWSDVNNAYEKFRPDSITVKLQYRVKSSPKTALEKLIARFSGDGWMPVLRTDGGETDSVYGTLNSGNGWVMNFQELPKYDKFGSELEYRAIETALILSDGDTVNVCPIGYKDETADTLVVDDSTVLPYQVSYQDGRITNTLKTVSLLVTKKWEDFSNRYGARPEKITLKITEKYSGLSYTLEWSSSQIEQNSNTWRIRYTNLPAYVRVGNAYLKAEYQVAELKVDEYQADLTKAAGTADNAYNAIITNTLNSGVVGEATLTKYGSREGGPKLAGAVYRLTRLKDDHSRWPLLTPKPGEDSPIEFYAGERDNAPIWVSDPKDALELTTGKAGTITVSNLPYGCYRFEEVKAPSGYYLSKKQVKFTVDKAHTDIAVFHVDPKVTDLPKTGDYIMNAVGVMAASGLILGGLWAYSKKKKK